MDRHRRRFSASQSDVRWIVLGYVAGSHGLQGGLRVKLHNPDSELLSELAEIGVRRDGETVLYAIRAVRGTGKGPLLELAGVDRVEAADALRGAELCVPRERLPPLPEGEFYFADLEGLPVFLPDGTASGVVERVQEYPASQVLRVKSEDGVREVPMRAPYLVEVDLPGRRIVVDELHDLDVEKPR